MKKLDLRTSSQPHAPIKRNSQPIISAEEKKRQRKSLRSYKIDGGDSA
jgi:hypothetical protein